MDKKVLYAGFTYFFSNFLRKSIDLKAFHTFGRISFRWLVLTVLSKEYWFEVFSSFWSSFFAGCLFLEVPSFSGQFERKAQNLEWGPSDSTHATFAVFTC